MGEEEARVRRREAVKEDWKGTKLPSRDVVAEGDGRTGFDRCLGGRLSPVEIFMGR